MAAKENTLGELHVQVADTLKSMLKDPDERSKALGHAVKFLKDNGIQCESGDPALEGLAKETGKLLNFPFQPEEAQG